MLDLDERDPQSTVELSGLPLLPLLSAAVAHVSAGGAGDVVLFADREMQDLFGNRAAHLMIDTSLFSPDFVPRSAKIFSCTLIILSFLFILLCGAFQGVDIAHVEPNKTLFSLGACYKSKQQNL